MDNQRRTDYPESYRGMFDVTPLEVRYWCPDGVLARNTFWMLLHEVLELQPEGDWKPAGFSYRNNLLTIEKTLETAGIGIFRLR